MKLNEGLAISSYTLSSRLGQGRYGEVWRAIRTTDGIEVAIKFFSDAPASTITNEDRARKLFFGNELLANSMGSHPGIVKFLEGGFLPKTLGTAEQYYIVMEYVAGNSLDKYIAKHGANLSQSESLQIVSRIAEALIFIHSRNVVHCDVKPANIITSTDDKGTVKDVKLVDFSVAKVPNHLLFWIQLGSSPVQENIGALLDKLDVPILTTTDFRGTRAYAAPEADKGDSEITEKTDVYSLGRVLCELLLGTLPPNGKNGLAVETKTLLTDKSITMDCVSLLENMMNPEPDKRLTMSEAKDKIASILAAT